MLQSLSKFNLFRKLFKSKQEKILNKIRHKRDKIDALKKKIRFEQTYDNRRKMQNQIDKLKEEIIKMGKYVLKDGKLVLDKEEQHEGKMPEVPTPPADMQVPKPQEPEVMSQVPRPQEPTPMPQPPLPQEPMYPQPPLPQEPMYPQPSLPQEPIYPQPPLPQEQVYSQAPQISREEMEHYMTQEQLAPHNVTEPQNQQVTIMMIENKEINVLVPSTKIDGFIHEVSSAMIEQKPMQINNRLINGRHIISLVF